MEAVWKCWLAPWEERKIGPMRPMDLYGNNYQFLVKTENPEITTNSSRGTKNRSEEQL